MTAEESYRFNFRVEGELTDRQKKFVEFLSKPANVMNWPDSLKGEMFETREYDDMKPRREEREEPKVNRDLDGKQTWNTL